MFGRRFTEIPQRDAGSVNGMENLSQETGEHSVGACGDAGNQGCTPSWCSFDKWFFCFFYSLFALCVVLDVYALVYRNVSIFIVAFCLSCLGVVTCTRNACCFLCLQIVVGIVLYANNLPIVRDFENMILVSIVANHSRL